MNILITGASGFIGSFLCEESLRRGWNTWAGVRATSSRRWLQYEGLQFAELDLTDTSSILQSFTSLTETVKAFQQAAFPNDRTQWDGVCGPLTWAKVLNFQ